MIIYLLGDYDESGTENLVATTDRGRLAELLESNWPLSGFYGNNERHRSEWIAEARAKLADLLTKSDADLISQKPHGLHRGWGGAVLYVLELAQVSDV